MSLVVRDGCTAEPATLSTFSPTEAVKNLSASSAPQPPPFSTRSTRTSPNVSNFHMKNMSNSDECWSSRMVDSLCLGVGEDEGVGVYHECPLRWSWKFDRSKKSTQSDDASKEHSPNQEDLKVRRSSGQTYMLTTFVSTHDIAYTHIIHIST